MGTVISHRSAIFLSYALSAVYLRFQSFKNVLLWFTEFHFYAEGEPDFVASWLENTAVKLEMWCLKQASNNNAATIKH